MKKILELTKFSGVVVFLCLLLISTSKAQNEESSRSMVSEAKKYYDLKAYDKAFPLFQEAAKEGNVEAYTFLGKMYYNGWGVGHDHEAAYEWHRKAAELGSEESKEKLKKFKHKADEHKKNE